MLCSQSRLAPYVVVRSELITVRAGDNLCYNHRCGAARVHRSAALPPLFSQNDKAMFFFLSILCLSYQGSYQANAKVMHARKVSLF